ncbi:hypothetical protein EDF66_11613 [Sphingobacterium sp. JUb20]|nr:hypothetical protein EDF66_11613 [Sphingobacterium sp. JUb20]
MLKYGSDTYLTAKKPRFTSDSDKRTVLPAIDSGMSIEEAKVVFGIHPVTIRGWTTKFAKNEKLTDYKSVVMSKHEIKSEVNDEIKELRVLFDCASRLLRPFFGTPLLFPYPAYTVFVEAR